MGDNVRRLTVGSLLILYAATNLSCFSDLSYAPQAIEGDVVLVGQFDSSIINLREFKILSTRIRGNLLQVRVFADDHCADGFGALMTPPQFDSTTPPSADIYVVNFGTGKEGCGETEGRVSFALDEVEATYFRQFSAADSVLLKIHGYRDRQLYELNYLPTESSP